MIFLTVKGTLPSFCQNVTKINWRHDFQRLTRARAQKAVKFNMKTSKIKVKAVA